MLTTSSTCEVEYVVLDNAAKEVMFLYNFINDLQVYGMAKIKTVWIYIDNSLA